MQSSLGPVPPLCHQPDRRNSRSTTSMEHQRDSRRAHGTRRSRRHLARDDDQAGADAARGHSSQATLGDHAPQHPIWRNEVFSPVLEKPVKRRSRNGWIKRCRFPCGSSPACGQL
jgi:hypothetical protein